MPINVFFQNSIFIDFIGNRLFIKLEVPFPEFRADIPVPVHQCDIIASSYMGSNGLVKLLETSQVQFLPFFLE